jgi:hypothetical protein
LTRTGIRHLGKTAITLFLILLPIVLSTCAGPTKSLRPAFVKGQSSTVLAECRDRADSNLVLETNELFAILDAKYWQRELLTALSLERWQQLVEDYKFQKGSGWWQEISLRIGYCREHCATAIGDSVRDVRWELVLRDGVPSVEWHAPGEREAADSTGVHVRREVFVYSWHNWGREVVCESAPGGDFPVKVVSRGGGGGTLELGQSITSHLSFAVFPNPGDSTFDIWVSSLTTGDQFTQASLSEGVLYLEFTMFDMNDALVGRDTLLAKLDLLRALSGVTQARDLGVMGYLSCRGLPRGEYTANLDLLGSGYNTGEYKKQVRIPSPYTSRGTSDLVVIDPLAASGPNVVPGITRPGRNLHVMSLSVFRTGGILHPYMEFRLPERADSNYMVRVVAIPITRDRSESRKSVAVGPIVHVEDTVGRVWGDTTRFDIGGETEAGFREENKEMPIFTLRGHYGKSKGVFDQDISLEGIDSGRYWIAVRVSEVSGIRRYGSAWAPIEVR